MCKYILQLFLICCLFTGCRKEQRLDYEHAISKQLESVFDCKSLKEYSLIILIPNSGCTGCIAEAENYFLYRKNDPQTLFIFTNYISERDLRLRLGMDRHEKLANVFFDAESKFYLSDYKESIYPVALYLQKGKVEKVTNMDELTILLDSDKTLALIGEAEILMWYRL